MPTVLVIDDEPEILAASQYALASPHYRVLTAAGGVMGLRLASRELPDAIIVDCNMSDMHGIEMCRRLKSYPTLAAIPVILLSGIPVPQHKSLLWNSFLRKPASPEMLLSELEALLLSRRPKDTVRRPVCNGAGSRWQMKPSVLSV